RTSMDDTTSYDGDLLFYIDRILTNDLSKNKLLIIHLIGAHVRYYNRYPPDFATLNVSEVKDPATVEMTDFKRKIINDYDNAILYNDFVVSQIIKRIKKENTASYVLYLSDHSEEVFDSRDFVGHEEIIGSRFMVEIPFIIWTSDQFQKNNPETITAMCAHTDTPYLTDDVIHTIFDLSSLSFDRYEPERSIVNKQFNPNRIRMYAGKNYDTELKKDTGRRLIISNYDKLWVHRVNSIGKLMEAAQKYSGVELDIVFVNKDDKPYFDVNHPPAPSINLHLDEYFKAAQDYPTLSFWLDCKNLNNDNHRQILNHLLKLIEKYNLKKRIIFESSHYQYLNEFSQHGIYSSYYLPYLRLNAMNKKQKIQVASELTRNIQSSALNAISFPGYMTEFVKTYIYPHVKHLDLMTWHETMDVTKPPDAVFIQEVINDPAIRIVLVGLASRYHR
ncbi:MAG: sulfatase-like hydrolase/transferase, partial [Elusimicrobia bacterium]|nr:sulfatase-like hydrolase/transferase [Elusimicrobiota bacterium]MBD3411504.1 sulfatase-like hydrolase/transferase [Elusimicrobiota bacterium]